MSEDATASITRRVLTLALPALGTLIAEPLLLATDTALVGHLGIEPLAGLALASTLLRVVLGLMVFLAYATTPTVARRLGAGDAAGAVRAGLDGMWLALLCALVLGLVGVFSVSPLVHALTADTAVAAQAERYLFISLFGLPAMLLVIAATGLLRGLQNTTAPLVITVVGCGINAALSALLIYGAGLGIAGAALGTVLAQWGMALAYCVIAARAARRHGTGLRPGLAGVGRPAADGGWMLVRNIALNAAILTTTLVATAQGARELAALQITMTVFTFMSFTLDSLAIAGQALTGHALGRADVAETRAITRALVRFALGFGVIVGVLIAALSGVLPHVFTGDRTLDAYVWPSLIALAATGPLLGCVFVLDGVLIGAGDARYLALAGLANLVPFAGAIVLVTLFASGPLAPMWLWLAFGGVLMLARAATLGTRAAGSAWMRVG